MMLFLSKGYFHSGNCLREIYATVTQAKPVCLVHEADVNKGGAPLAQLRSECPEATPDGVPCRSFVFTAPDGAERPVVTWMQIADFQKESLKQIGASLLQGNNLTASQAAAVSQGLGGAPALYIPGEATHYRLMLKKPLVLYASSSNPGAAAVADEARSDARAAYCQLQSARRPRAVQDVALRQRPRLVCPLVAPFVAALAHEIVQRRCGGRRRRQLLLERGGLHAAVPERADLDGRGGQGARHRGAQGARGEPADRDAARE